MQLVMIVNCLIGAITSVSFCLISSLSVKNMLITTYHFNIILNDVTDKFSLHPTYPYCNENSPTLYMFSVCNRIKEHMGTITKSHPLT